VVAQRRHGVVRPAWRARGRRVSGARSGSNAVAAAVPARTHAAAGVAVRAARQLHRLLIHTQRVRAGSALRGGTARHKHSLRQTRAPLQRLRSISRRAAAARHAPETPAPLEPRSRRAAPARRAQRPHRQTRAGKTPRCPGTRLPSSDTSAHYGVAAGCARAARSRIALRYACVRHAEACLHRRRREAATAPPPWRAAAARGARRSELGAARTAVAVPAITTRTW
jgi:hypothetical protein